MLVVVVWRTELTFENDLAVAPAVPVIPPSALVAPGRTAARSPRVLPWKGNAALGPAPGFPAAAGRYAVSAGRSATASVPECGEHFFSELKHLACGVEFHLHYFALYFGRVAPAGIGWAGSFELRGGSVSQKQVWCGLGLIGFEAAV